MKDGDDRPLGSDRRGRRRPVDHGLGDNRSDDAWTWGLFARDLLTSALAVLLVGALLFAVSGVWPPLVAVESGSMTPNMHKNDLVFVMEESRFPGGGAIDGTGVVTAETGAVANHSMFGGTGDVIVYKPNGREDAVPIIHRAMLHVDRDENWYDRANPDYVGGAPNCQEMPNCPAEYAGFITKGDDNDNYDQVGPRVISDPVKADWVVGTAEVRVPGLGWLRLRT